MLTLNTIERAMKEVCKDYMKGEDEMRRPKGKQCKDCFYYPDNCGYWDIKKRKKENATYCTPKTVHNCSDFIKRSNHND